MTSEVSKLPELPQPIYAAGSHVRQFTADQMHEYALAAIAADAKEIEHAQANMDAGWYARREAHAKAMGYSGVAEALEDLERMKADAKKAEVAWEVRDYPNGLKRYLTQPQYEAQTKATQAHYKPLCAHPSPDDFRAVCEALRDRRDWFETQAKAISKGDGSTWDLMQVREQRDLFDKILALQSVRAAIGEEK